MSEVPLQATSTTFRAVPGQAGFQVQMDYAENVYDTMKDFIR
jgi:hypothetical protein